MAEIGGQLGVAGAFAGTQKRQHDLAILGGGEKPVAREGDAEGLGLDAGEGLLERTIGGRQVKVVERPGDVEIGIGVEPVDEALGLVPEVAFDFELDIKGVGGGRTHRRRSGGEAVEAGLPRRGRCGSRGRCGRSGFAPAELQVHALVGQVGDVRHHARDGETDARTAALRVIAAVPLGVLHDGLAADLVEGDGLGALPGCRGHRDQATDEGGVFNSPLQDLHPAHRAAHDGVERGEAEMVAQQSIRPHHVANGHKGEGESEGPPGLRVGRGGAAGALAAAEDVGANDEEMVRVDGLGGADEVVPPTGLGVGQGMDARAMVVAAERMADQDSVVVRGVEAAVGFVAQGEAGQDLAALEAERLRTDKIMRLDEADLAGFRGRAGNVLLRVVHEMSSVNHRSPQMNTDFCVIAERCEGPGF